MKLSKTEYNSLKESGLQSSSAELSPFAEACYNDNSYNELKTFATDESNTIDMEAWDISEGEWRECQEEALQAAMYYFEDEHEC